MVLGYLKDLNGVLNTASLGEQRTFLRSFIQSVERYDSQVTIRYARPFRQRRCSLILWEFLILSRLVGLTRLNANFSLGGPYIGLR